MTHALDRTGVSRSDTDERARRAVTAFRALQPTLTAYARMLTRRNDVRVEMSADDNGSTDGKKIFFRPPIALGDRTPHVRRDCDRRNENKQLICKACSIREDVLVVIYHEIAHIAYDSFAPVSDHDRAETVKHAIAEYGSKYSKKIEADLKKYGWGSYAGLAYMLGPYFNMIVNALEDARIEAKAHVARPGTRVMFESRIWDTFTNGFEAPAEDGGVKTIFWKERPLDAQAAVGLYVKAANYDNQGWFAPEVELALSDSVISKLCADVRLARTPSAVYALAFPILARMRQYGFFKLEHEPEDEPEDEPLATPPTPPETEEPNEDTGSDGDDPSDEVPEAGGDSGGNSDDDDTADSPDTDGDSDDKDGTKEKEGDSDDSADGTDSNTSDSDPAGDSEPARGDEGPENEGDADGGDEVNDNEGDMESADQADGSPENEAGGDPGVTGGTSDVSLDPGQSGDGSGSTPGQEDNTSSRGGDGEELGGSDTSVRSGESDLDSHEEEPVEHDGSAPGQLDEIDTLADEGKGGIEVDQVLDHGTAEEAEAALVKVLGHDKIKASPESKAEDSAIGIAIIQGNYFETPSTEVHGVNEERFGDHREKPRGAWRELSGYTNIERRKLGFDAEIDIAESLLGRALLKMRVAFSDNARANEQRHLKRGKVDARVLGKRAHALDERLFKKRTIPGKRSYKVVIMLDCSGSTAGKNMILQKEAVYGQAEMLHRMGIDFAVYGHSCSVNRDTEDFAYDMDIYIIKEFGQPWDTKSKGALTALGPDNGNLDGHALEYARRKADSVTATDKVILYYSDGKMPASNHDEELEILQREIRTCAAKHITLLGVGIRTDSPAQHGLPTVQVDSVEDLGRPVEHLKAAILKNKR